MTTKADIVERLRAKIEQTKAECASRGGTLVATTIRIDEIEPILDLIEKHRAAIVKLEDRIESFSDAYDIAEYQLNRHRAAIEVTDANVRMIARIIYGMDQDSVETPFEKISPILMDDLCDTVRAILAAIGETVGE